MIKKIFQFCFPKNNLDALIPAAIAFAIIFICTRHSGVGITPDSVLYISVARNIDAHGIFVGFDNRPLVIFPVFYPFFLGTLMFITGKDPLVFATLLNCCLFFVVIYLCGWILEKLPRSSKLFKHIILGCLVFSACLIEIYTMVWSETLFILLSLLFFISLKKYFQKLSLISLLLPASIAAFAGITRFAGVTIIFTGCLLLLLNPKLILKKKIYHILIFGFISSSLLTINLARNFFKSETLTGLREQSTTSLNDNIYFVGNTFCDWLNLPEDHYALSYGLALTVIIGCAITIIYYVYRKNYFDFFEIILTAYFLVYSLFIITSATFSRYEQINSRLFSPSFIPFVVGFSYVVLALIKKNKNKLSVILSSVATIIILSFGVSELKVSYGNYKDVKDTGILDYTEDSWNKNSELINFLKKNSVSFQKGYTIYSNCDDAVYFFTGLPCNYLPHKAIEKEIQQFETNKLCYIIWMNDKDNPELIGLDRALSLKKMVCLYKFSNGSIYVAS